MASSTDSDSPNTITSLINATPITSKTLSSTAMTKQPESVPKVTQSETTLVEDSALGKPFDRSIVVYESKETFVNNLVSSVKKVKYDVDVELENPGGVKSVDGDMLVDRIEVSDMEKALIDVPAVPKVKSGKRSDKTEKDVEIVKVVSGSIGQRLKQRKQPVYQSLKRKRNLVDDSSSTGFSTDKLEFKTEEALSKVKMEKTEKIIVGGREIITEMECSEEFLASEGFAEVYDLLKFQGWETLCAQQDYINPNQVLEFYKNMTYSAGRFSVVESIVNKKKIRMSSPELGALLDLKHSGYDDFSKVNWPTSDESRNELTMKICKVKYEKGSTVKTKLMDPSIKMLHKLLVCNYIQRGAKQSTCQFDDLLCMEKMLSKERVNLPKLILYQMDHLKSLAQIGYARVIKQILIDQDVYDSSYEVPIQRCFDKNTYRKMGMKKEAELGWVRIIESPAPKKKKLKSDVKVEEKQILDDVSDVAGRMERIEKGVEDIYDEFAERQDKIEGKLEDLQIDMFLLKADVKKLITLVQQKFSAEAGPSV